MNDEVNKIYNDLVKEMKLPERRYKEPFIVTLCGYSGSGKSMISKILSSELSLYIIGGDKIRNIYYYDENANHDIDYINKVVNEVVPKEIKYLLNNGVSIVLDRSVSSKESVNKLKELCDNLVMINLISDHKINIERVTNRKEYNIDTSKCYGDIDSKSGVDSVEVYNEILERKEYNLESSDFNYSIDATKDVDYVIEKAKEIAKDISLKNIDNK